MTDKDRVIPGYAPLMAEIQAAEKVGRYVGRSWSNVDTDDIVGELLLWLCANGRHVVRWRTEGAHGMNKLKVALKREAQKYARREHIAMTGAGGKQTIDDSAYSEAELEVLLAYVFSFPEWAALGQDNTEPLASLADVSSAVFGLTRADLRLLVARYGDDRSLRDIGEELECSEDAARMRVKRTLDRLRQRLSGEEKAPRREVRTA